MRHVTFVVAGLLALTLTAALGALSRVPYGSNPEGLAILRLSWRATGQRVEACRPLTEEEQARTPAHMRPPEICEGRLLPYALHVRLDDRVLIADTLRPAGARADRPIYVYRERAIPPGRHRLDVRFRVVLPDLQSRAVEDEPPETTAWHLEADLDLRPGEIALVTRAEDEAGLLLRGSRP